MRGWNVYNVGSGIETSIGNLMQTFESTIGVKLEAEYLDPKKGEISRRVANIEKVKAELGWTPKLTLTRACKDAWKFY
jgi:UDP-glucose 4-epimerase